MASVQSKLITDCKHDTSCIVQSICVTYSVHSIYITVDIQREQSITLQFRIYRLLFNNT